MMRPVSIQSWILGPLLWACFLTCDGHLDKLDGTYVAAVYEHRPSFLHILDTTILQDVEIEQNLNRYVDKIEEAATKGAEIIVFPEDGIFGMLLNRSAVYPYLELVPDPVQAITNPCTESVPSARNKIQQRLSCAARSSKIFVVANFATVEFCQDKAVCPPDGRFQFNTNVVFDTEGNIIARYHKTSLFYEEQFDVPPTVELSTFQTSFGNFGTFICFDILFKQPAVDLIELGEVQNIAFSTAWRNVIPQMFSIGFHESWAIRMGVNLLSAEIHIPEVDFQGSGVYSGQDGTLAYYNNDHFLSAGRMVISNVTRTPIGPIQSLIHMPNDATSLIPRERFTSFMEGDPYIFTRLNLLEGDIYLEHMETKCYLKYKMLRLQDQELFGFGIFQGLHKSALNSYVQVCALVKCSNSSFDSCGQPTRISTTIFSSLTIVGEFSGNYIFPAVLFDGLNPSKKDWTFYLDKGNNRGQISFSSVKKPLVSAILYTRLYDKDDNPPPPTYSKSVKAFQYSWEVRPAQEMGELQHGRSVIEAVGILVMIAILASVAVLVIFWKKHKKYNQYTRL